MGVQTDFSPLKKVMIHEPDIGIGYITPAIAEQLLYDDIVFLPRMIEEHYVFTQALRVLIGEEHVLEIEDLLSEVLDDTDARNSLIKIIAQQEDVQQDVVEHLLQLDSKQLSQVLISGMDDDHTNWLKPLPNLVFTRDLSCVIQDYILLSKMNKDARSRESVLFRYVVQYHPVFSEFKDKTLQLTETPHHFHEKSIEGGDVMIVHPEYVLIGISERTTWDAFMQVKDELLQKGIVKNVVAVKLPSERYCMHLDTVFTVLSEDFCVGYAPLVFENNSSLEIIKYSKGATSPIIYQNLKDLMQEIYPQITCIPCGNGIAPFDAREQWTDGANLVTVDRNVAFAYERNVHTLQAFRKNGFNVLDARHLVNYSTGEIELLKQSPLIITISSAELSRARGGPHCMTMPIKRKG